MRIIKPNVEFYQQDLNSTNINSHVARCARITRHGDKGDDDKLVKLLKDSKHYSVFRHASAYFIIPDMMSIDKQILNIIENCESSPYIESQYNVFQKCFYIATNHQYLIEHPIEYDILKQYEVCGKAFNEHSHISHNMMRYSVMVTTQISTSRELNRTSPNAITEESTRYCNYSKEKFGNDVTICQPFWFNIFKIDEEEAFYNEVDDTIIIHDVEGQTNGYPISESIINVNEGKFVKQVVHFIRSAAQSCENYIYAINNGFTPQEARELLPLCTATRVVYTYSINEWKNILNLRYYGTTGAPHPNAKIIASKIRDLINNEGYFL